MLKRPYELAATDFPIPHRSRGEFAEVLPLLALCARGKLYEVEQWIRENRPIQFPPSDDRKVRRHSTPLHIAIDRGFYSLVALLLANGYDPNGDYYECLSTAVRAKDRDMIELLLRFGADPRAVDFCTVLETSDRGIMDRFIEAGADPCRENALARALSTKSRPILGFIKQYRDRFPGIQRQVDIALRPFTEEESVKGVALLLWVGADPHAEVPATAYESERENGVGGTAFESALWARKPEILPQFLKRRIPAEKIPGLLSTVAYRNRPDLVQRLLDDGADVNAVSEDGEPPLSGFISGVLWRYSSRSAEEQARGMAALELVLKAGAKWSPDEGRLKSLRRDLAEGESRVVIRLLELLRKYSVFTPDQLHELTRTPAVKRVLNGVSKPRRDPFAIHYAPPPLPVTSPAVATPTRGYWKRHWSQR